MSGDLERDSGLPVVMAAYAALTQLKMALEHLVGVDLDAAAKGLQIAHAFGPFVGLPAPKAGTTHHMLRVIEAARVLQRAVLEEGEAGV